MLTIDRFRTKYPEFNAAEPTLVQELLDEEWLNVSDSWEGRVDTVHGLRTASRLQNHPLSRNVREDGEGVDPYQKRLEDLELGHMFGRNRVHG